MKSLILAAQRGNAEALVRLADALSQRVRTIAARYARLTAEDFDDLLQEAWIGVLEAVPDVKTDVGDPGEYLLKRAQWRVLDYLKLQRRRRCESLEECAASEVIGAEQSAADASTATVDELLTHLSQTQRQLVRMLLAGFTWREAAGRLGCGSSNIAYHVNIIRRTYTALDSDTA